MERDEAEAEYRGYEVTVFIPDAAPKEVCEAIFEAVADACNREEEVNPALRDRKGWDLAIEGSPADHRTEAAFSRVVDECSTRIDERDAARATIDRIWDLVLGAESEGQGYVPVSAIRAALTKAVAS